MAKFGTTKVYQILPRCFKGRSHGVGFRGLCMHSPLVPAQLARQGPFDRSVGSCGLPLVFVHDGWSIISMRIQHHIPLASNIKQPTFALYACSHATIGGFCTKFCSGIYKSVPIFHQNLPFQILHVRPFKGSPGTCHEALLPRSSCFVLAVIGCTPTCGSHRLAVA